MKGNQRQTKPKKEEKTGDGGRVKKTGPRRRFETRLRKFETRLSDERSREEVMTRSGSNTSGDARMRIKCAAEFWDIDDKRTS